MVYKIPNDLGRRFLSRLSGAIVSFLDTFPLGVAPALAAFGAVAMVLLLLGELRDAIVWPVGLAAALGAYWLAVRRSSIDDRSGSKKEHIVCSLIVSILVLSWGVLNIRYASQHVFVNRDPAVYAVTGAWLTNHESAVIKADNVFGEKFDTKSAGFFAADENEKQLHAQGQHLLPIFLGLIGRLGGESAMLHANLLFGMTALLSVYAFARLLVRPRFAVLGVAVLAVSLPMLYFSRDTYTEPLALTFVFGALALIWTAQKTGHLSKWLLAGVVMGAGALTRIDAYLSMAGVVLFVAVLLALARKQERANRIKQSLALLAGMTAIGVIGWLDIYNLSTKYYFAHETEFFQELALIGVILIFGLMAVILSWRTNILQAIDSLTRRWRHIALPLLVVAFALFLMSRPLWHTGHRPADKVTPAIIQGIQRDTGATIDTARTYSEYAFSWAEWYIGTVMVVLGVAGVALMSNQVVKRRSLLLAPFLLVFVINAGIYLIRPSISPDQIWAARRLLPVILPGFVVGGVFALGYADKALFSRRRLHAALFVVLAGILGVLAPLLTSRHFLSLRENTQLVSVNATCASLPKDAALLWVGRARLVAVQTTRSFCGVPTAGYGPHGPSEKVDKPTLSDAAKNAAAKGYRPVIGVFGEEAYLFSEQDRRQLTRVHRNEYERMQQTLVHSPNNRVEVDESILLGLVEADGSISPIEVDGQ